MRIKLPPEWAGRRLNACVPGGDPFVVAFDAQAEAVVTAEQGAYLHTLHGLRAVIMEGTEADDAAALSRETGAPPSSPEEPAADVLTPAKAKARRRGPEE